MNDTAWLVGRTLSKICSEYHRAIQDSCYGVVAGQWLLMELHRKADADRIAILPDAADRKIGARIGNRFKWAAVNLHLSFFGRPVWNAQVDGALLRVRRFDLERRTLLARELRDLLDDEAFVFPIQRGRNKLVDKDVAATAEVDRVGELGELFGTGASAAPERFFGGVIGAPVSGGEREEVLLQALRILRA